MEEFQTKTFLIKENDYYLMMARENGKQA